LGRPIFNDHVCEQSLSHTYIVFHFFELSNISDESFLEKLKRIVKKKEETRKNIVHEQEKKRHKKETTVTKDEMRKKTQVPHLRIVNL
jgi:hypothetical protein